MYLNFFGFHKKPFSLTPDPSFFFPSESHQQGLAYLRSGIREREGFISLTGEVGTGKTHLVRLLLQELGPEVKRALILYPVLDADDLLSAIMQDLDIQVNANMELREKLEVFVEYLLKEYQQGNRVLIIIDESHNLSIQALERLRLLSNLETAGAKLVQILLVGQPELNLLLKLPPLRSLNQRISVRHHLESLSRKDTEEYINHRLMVAGGPNVEVIFTKGAARLIHRASRGVPRMVSILCDFSLVMAFTVESSKITPKIAREAIRLFRSKAVPTSPKRMELAYFRHNLIPALAGGLVLLIVLGLLGWNLMKPGHDTATQTPVVSIRPSFLSTTVEDPRDELTPEQETSHWDSPATEPAIVAAPNAIPAEDVEPVIQVANSTHQQVTSFLADVPAPAAPAAPAVPAAHPVPQPPQQQEAIVGASLIPAAAPVKNSQPHMPEEPPLPSAQSNPWKSLPSVSTSNPIETLDATLLDGKRYGVQIASTKSADKAREMAKGLSAMGPVYVVPTTSGKGNRWIKIVLGAFESYEEALVVAQKLNSSGKAKDACVVNNSWWKSNLSEESHGVIVVENNPRVASTGSLR